MDTIAEYNLKKYIFIVIYDEMESNLAQINVIRCKSIIMQMTQVFSLQHECTTYIYTCYLKNQTVKPSLVPGSLSIRCFGIFK